MPTKVWRLVVRDLSFYLTGSTDVEASNWKADPWIYPLDWSFQLDRDKDYFAPLDAEGIPLREFAPPIGLRYVPSRVAGFGLAHWNRHCTRHDDRSRTAFLHTANWFLTRGVDGRYFYDILVAGKTAPWISCIAQGEAASILVRANQLTGDDRYGEAARRAAHWLLVPERDGGLKTELPDGRPFVEEYPETQYRHVLNGCLYAAVGLSDLCRYIGDDEECRAFRQFFSDLSDSIATNILSWDVDGWSTYDYSSNPKVPRNLNTMTYQALQVVLLRYLGEVTGDERLLAVSERWGSSLRHLPTRLRALRGKLVYRVTAGW